MTHLSGESAMNNKLPITLLAQIDNVAVFQTAAFSGDADINSESIFQKIAQQTEQQNQANYGQLNLGLHVDDDAKVVLNNRMRLLAAINKQVVNLSSDNEQCSYIKHLHWVNQIHGKQIHDINATTLSMQPLAADAMVSQQDDVGLAIMTADCVPIVLYQPATGQIAAIHAGWQGLACGVIHATTERFGSSGKIMAWIGVCISQHNYEVGCDVRDRLRKGCLENQLLTATNMDKFNQRYVIDSADNINGNSNARVLYKTVAKPSSYATVGADKVKIDLPRLAADQLMSAGIIVESQPSNACSYSDRRYYSYRRQTHLQQSATGRMALIITRSAPIY